MYRILFSMCYSCKWPESMDHRQCIRHGSELMGETQGYYNGRHKH
jgi:hypothetical protein